MISLSTDDRRDLIRWIISGAIVVLAHVGVAMAMMRWHDLAEAADPASAIVIELAALPIAPAAEPSDIPIGPEQNETKERPPEELQPKDEQPEQKAPEKTEEQVATKPEENVVEKTAEQEEVATAEKLLTEETPEQQVARLQEAHPEEKAAEQDSKVVATLAPNPEVIVSPPRSEARQQSPELRKPEPKPRANAKSEPKPKSRSQAGPPPAPATTRPQPAPVRQAALPAARSVGAPAPANPNALPNWKSQIMGILQRNKRYPPEAQARHEQGVAQLAFSVDRGGRVVSARIAGSSGSSALDAETLALVRRSSPFPPPPPGIGGGQISLTIPIRFGIR